MADDNELIVEIALDDGSVQKGFKRVETGAKKTTEKIDKNFNATTAKLKSNFATIGASFAAAFTLRQIQKAVDTFAAFEKSLVGVQKTTNLSGLSLKEFGRDIQQLSLRIPVATNDLLNLAKQAGQFGVEGADDLLVFTETVAKLSAAIDGVDPQTAAQGLIRILKISKESTKEVKTLASVVVSLGNNLATNEGEIINTALEISRVGGAFGFTSSQTTQFGAAFAALGVTAQVAGTSVSKTLLAIDESIQKNNKSLSEFAKVTGLSVKEFKKLFSEDSGEVFNLFVKGLNKIQLAGGSVSRELTKLGLSEQRVRKSLLSASQGFSEFEKAANLVNEELKNTVSLDIEAAKAFDTLDAQIITTGNNFTRLGSNIGALLSGPYKKFLGATNDIVEGSNLLFESILDDTSPQEKEINILTNRIGALQTQINKFGEVTDEVSIFSFLSDPFFGGKSSSQIFDELDTELTTALERVEELKAEISTTETPIIDPPPPPPTEETSDENSDGLSVFEAFKLAGTGAEEDLKKLADTADVQFKKIGASAARSLGKGVGNAFAAFGKAVATGENALEAFGKALLASIGQTAISLGTNFILTGAAYAFSGDPQLEAKAAPLIGAGAALAAFGGVLSGLSGGASAGTSGGGDGGGGGETNTVEPELAEAQPTNKIDINIAGDVLDSDETGLRITTLLQNELDKSGTSILQVT